MKIPIIFISVCLSIWSINNAYKFENKTTSSGIMFSKLSQVELSYEQWTICYFYDLFEENMKHMAKICEQIKNDTQCPKLLFHIENHFEKMNNDKNLINHLNTNNKTKRGLAGNIYHFFGLLNSDDAKRYDEEIIQLRNNAIINNKKH